MPRRPVLAIAVLSALTGCVSSPPDGPLVEYRAGLTPITRPVPCAGTYVLCAAGTPASQPLAAQEVAEGRRIGFRRMEDGSVTAIGPELELPLPPGAYVWEVVPGTVAPWADRFRVKAGEYTGRTVLVAGTALVAVAVVTVVIGAKILYAYAASGAH